MNKEELEDLIGSKNVTVESKSHILSPVNTDYALCGERRNGKEIKFVKVSKKKFCQECLFKWKTIK